MTPHDHPPPVRWARAQKRLPLAPKAVLMLVAQQADAQGFALIRPEALGADLGMGAEAVMVHLRALVDAELVKVHCGPLGWVHVALRMAEADIPTGAMHDQRVSTDPLKSSLSVAKL